MPVTIYLKICQFTAFFIAIFANTLLLFLIKLRAGASFGRYRILMVTFSVYTLGYAVVEVLTLPIMHIHKSGIIVYPNSFLKPHKTGGLIVSTLYCGSFALCLALLAQHFVYRYFAVCKFQKMFLFDGKLLLLWFLPPLILFVVWSQTIYFNFGPDDFKQEFFRNDTMEKFGDRTDRIAFLATVYFVRDGVSENGRRRYRLVDMVGVVECCIVMNLCLSTCTLCAYKTYRKLHTNTIEMSARTKRLNQQLFRTLALQTLLPCLTQYTPVGLLFALPFFELNIGQMGVLVGATCCLYPALDPLIAIFMIDTFRNFLFRKEKSSISKSTVSDVTRTTTGV